MVTDVQLNNYDEFDRYWNNIDPKGPEVYFYFSGTKVNGVSWCPDCCEAEPIVKAYLSEIEKNVIFAFVDVGDVTYWRNAQCPFRTDNRIRLMQIPTIIKWKGVKRLEGTQCSKRELLEMLFNDDEE